MPRTRDRIAARMEAHESFERFEKVAEAGAAGNSHADGLTRHAAVLVAVMAGFLAIATFLSN